MTASAPSALERLTGDLARRGVRDFELAFVLGSGLGAFADRLRDPLVVPFDALADMPRSAVPGHAGRFVLGELGGARVLVQQGRVHLYEGWSVHEVTRPVRAMARLGCRSVVLTNAAGGIADGWPVPCLMRVTDHLNLQGVAPLARAESGRGNPYDVELGQRIDGAARALGLELRHGVYAGLLGPAYETPAEVRLLATMGAQAVGMSTVCEALAAHAEGLRVGAVSCISNAAAGISAGPLAHAEVVAAGAALAADLGALLERIPAPEQA
jgi:purine-nucleoside phosphorylase